MEKGSQRLTVNSPISLFLPLFEDVFLTVWLKRLKAQKLLAQGVWGFAFFLFKNYLKIKVVSLSLSNSS